MNMTHIETLADANPKSRRRVLAILYKETGEPIGTAEQAQAFSRTREQSGAVRDAAKRSAGGAQ